MLAACALGLACAAPAGAVTRADREATDAYLRASVTLDESLLASAPNSASAVDSLTARLTHECPGALAHAPQGLSSQPPRKQNARERGERDREQSQLFALREELETSVLAAELGPDRAALAAYRSAVAGLVWSDPKITRSVLADASALAEESSFSVGNVCADARAWAASGYRTLTPATQESEARFAELIEASVEQGRPLDTRTVELLVAHEEGERGRALARRLAELEARLARSSLQNQDPSTRLARALGFHEEEEPAPRRAKVRLGRGSTLAGGQFVLSAERAPPELGHGCRYTLELEYSQPGGQGLSGNSTSIGGSGCGGVGRLHPHPVSCEGGELQLEYRTPADVRRVRLALSDGRRITSPVVAVPVRYGGPFGFYFQAVRGPWPIPVSLTELDGAGRVVRVVRLRPVRGCRPKPEPEPTVLTLVQAAGPGGTSYTIRGITFPGARSHQVSLLVKVTPRAGSIVEGESGGAAARLFEWSLHAQCPPHQLAILYGLVKAPGDTVLARSEGTLVPLGEQPLPPQLHSTSVLAYDAFASPPTELVVRSATGQTLATESLAARASEDAEYCLGYAG